MRSLSLLAGLLLGCLVGCGSEEGPVRSDISGKVIFAGSPAPGGSIIFTPDNSQGNSGPQGTAAIVDGKYDSSKNGRGIVGGPHEVRIIITNGDPSGADAELAGPLAEHTCIVDFPKGEATYDFNIAEKSD